MALYNRAKDSALPRPTWAPQRPTIVSLCRMQSERFVPAWWLPGPHFQTLGARFLRSRRGIEFHRERLELPDGDFIDLDWAITDGKRGRQEDEKTPIVVVLHGLEGSARSKYAIETYRQLLARDVTPVGLNFRSCSGELNRLPRMYHSGETADLAFVLRTLRARHAKRPFGAIGFSLGGNVLLKYLGQHAGSTEHTFPDVAAAVSVPFDLAAGADYIDRGMSRVYLAFLLRKLKRKIRGKEERLAGLVDVHRVLRSRGFRDFDDTGTAPLHGFLGADDYYARSSSNQFLAAIDVTTLLIHSEDDPFLPSNAIPRAAAAGNPNIESRFVNNGGHVGFVEGLPWRPRFWAEATAAAFVSRHLAEST